MRDATSINKEKVPKSNEQDHREAESQIDLTHHDQTFFHLSSLN
jgi:hypothetical protein